MPRTQHRDAGSAFPFSALRPEATEHEHTGQGSRDPPPRLRAGDGRPDARLRGLPGALGRQRAALVRELAFRSIAEDATAVETTIAAPFERVWRALRDRDEIRRWHGWDYDGLDEEIDVIYFRDVEADEAAGTLTMADGSRFELERAGDATVVRVTMAAAEDGYDEIREGWISFVMQLRFALERHPGEERRTFRLRASAPDDPGVTGAQLYRTEHQTGSIVDEYGPGLVIRYANGMAIVTTYGLDDDAFGELERRWRDRY
jgi:hypothetical protein